MCVCITSNVCDCAVCVYVCSVQLTVSQSVCVTVSVCVCRFATGTRSNSRVETRRDIFYTAATGR